MQTRDNAPYISYMHRNQSAITLNFFRRKQNDTFFRRLFPWLRVPPASPVASNTVVIMCNRLDGDGNERSKIDIDNVLKEHLAARGISAIHTRVGVS